MLSIQVAVIIYSIIMQAFAKESELLCLQHFEYMSKLALIDRHKFV